MIFWAFSTYSPSFIRTPFSAPFPVPTMIADGVAMPSAQGHAMMMTAMKNTRACATDSPRGTDHRKNVRAAIPTTAGTNTDATRSASRWIGARDACASSTSLMIWFRVVSAPTRVRSEEHTSELQSPYDLVCRLLLEKKKQRSDSVDF